MDTAAVLRQSATGSDTLMHMHQNKLEESPRNIAGPSNIELIVKAEQGDLPPGDSNPFAMQPVCVERNMAAVGSDVGNRPAENPVGDAAAVFRKPSGGSSSPGLVTSSHGGNQPETPVPCHVIVVPFSQPPLPSHCPNTQFKSPKSYWLRRHSDSLLVASSLSSPPPLSSPAGRPDLAFFGDNCCPTGVGSVTTDGCSPDPAESHDNTRRLKSPLTDLHETADCDDVFEDAVSDDLSPVVIAPRSDSVCFAGSSNSDIFARGAMLPSPPPPPVLAKSAHRNDWLLMTSGRPSVNNDDIVDDRVEENSSLLFRHQFFDGRGPVADGRSLLWHAQHERAPTNRLSTFRGVPFYQENYASDEQALNLSHSSRSPSGQLTLSIAPPTFPDRCSNEESMAVEYSSTPPSPHRQSRPASAGSRRQKRHAPSPAADSPVTSTSMLGEHPEHSRKSTAHSSSSSSSSASGKSHRCSVCRKSFSRSDMLERHVRLHTGIRPYACKLCSQEFSRSDHLTTHLRTHTGEKPYSCPRCSYSASRRDMVTRHLRVHMQEGVGHLEVSSTPLQVQAANGPGVAVVATPLSRCRGQQLRNKDRYRGQSKVGRVNSLSTGSIPTGEQGAQHLSLPWIAGMEPDVMARLEKIPGTSVIVGPVRGSPTLSDGVAGRQLERDKAPGRRGLSLILAGHGSTGSTDSYSSIGPSCGDLLETGGLAEGSPDVFRSPLSATRQAFKFMWPYDASPLATTSASAAFFQQ